MPTIQMPNGDNVDFPDDMPREQIKGLIASKFPELAAPSAPQAPLSFAERIKSALQEPANIAARTGRIATGIAGGALDLPSTVGQLAYDATRGAQSEMGMQVAPEYKVPLPSEGLKGVYDLATGGAGKSTGQAATIDKFAEVAAPLTGLATKVIPEIAKLAVPRVKGVANQLAQRAGDFNIPLRIDQIAPSRPVNALQKVSQEIPFSGVDASEATQLQAWNKALAKTLGQDADNLAPEVMQQFKQTNAAKFKDALSDANILIAPEDIKAIKDIQIQAPSKIGSNSLGVVRNNVKTALTDLVEGNMAGEKLSNVRSYFVGNMAEAEGGAKQSIGKIINIIDDIATRNVSPEKAAILAESRREWRNYRTVEPLLNKSPDGNINPTELINKVSSNKYIKAHTKKIGEDDLVDLARVGKRFLAKKGGSDTFSRTLAGGGIGGMGALLFTNPLAAAGAAGMAGIGMGTNRGLQALNQSPNIINTALTSRNFNPNINTTLAALAAGTINNQ